MTDKHKGFEEWALSDEGAYHESELRKSSQGKYALPATRIASESWQACQQLNDNRIKQLLAVIAKQKEVLTIVNDTVTHGAGAFIKDSLLHTNIEEALALTADDVELVEVNHVDYVEVDPAHYDVVSTLDDGEKLYKIQMKGK